MHMLNTYLFTLPLQNLDFERARSLVVSRGEVRWAPCSIHAANVYPIAAFLSPPQIYNHGLKSEFKPTGLKYEPIFNIRENTKTLQVQLFFPLNISEIYRIPS